MAENVSAAFSYDITYAGFCLLCAVLFLAMSTQLNENIGNRREVRILWLLLQSSMLECLSNCVDKIGSAGLMPYPAFLSWLMNGLDLLATLGSCYFWFLLIDSRSTRKFFSGRRRTLVLIPAMIVLLLTVTSVFTGAIFSVAPDGSYARGPLYVVQIVGCYFYYFTATGICFAGVVRGSVMERDLFKKLLTYSVLPILGGGMQVAIGILPFTAATMLISIFYTFIHLQNQRIDTDAMTRLNNKLATQRYVERRARTADRDPFWFFMLDVNHFKSINDTYGHLMGDQAIFVVSDALRRTAEKMGGFVGRFGGDEFTAVVEMRRFRDPETFEAQMNLWVTRLMARAGLDIPLTVGVGYTSVERAGDSVDSIIARADTMLYAKKKNRDERR